jgi:hypothetical protein
MSLHLHDETARQADDALQPRGLEGRQREEEIHHAMATDEPGVPETTVEDVECALLAWLEGEVPANQDPGREESLQQHIGTEVHVMMTVDAARSASYSRRNSSICARATSRKAPVRPGWNTTCARR